MPETDAPATSGRDEHRLHVHYDYSERHGEKPGHICIASYPLGGK